VRPAPGAEKPQIDAAERSPSPCPVCGVDIWEPRHFNKHLPERYGGPPKPRRDPHAERSVVDAICEGDFNHLPDDVQARLRAVANHRFLSTVDAQWAAAADILREYRDG
jgi:hypothetical protein